MMREKKPNEYEGLYVNLQLGNIRYYGMIIKYDKFNKFHIKVEYQFKYKTYKRKQDWWSKSEKINLWTDMEEINPDIKEYYFKNRVGEVYVEYDISHINESYPSEPIELLKKLKRKKREGFRFADNWK